MLFGVGAGGRRWATGVWPRSYIIIPCAFSLCLLAVVDRAAFLHHALPPHCVCLGASQACNELTYSSKQFFPSLNWEFWIFYPRVGAHTNTYNNEYQPFIIMSVVWTILLHSCGGRGILLLMSINRKSLVSYYIFFF